MKTRKSGQIIPGKITKYRASKNDIECPRLTKCEIKTAKSQANELAPVINQLLQEKFPKKQLGFAERTHSYAFIDGNGYRLIDHSLMAQIIRKAIKQTSSKREKVTAVLKEDQS